MVSQVPSDLLGAGPLVRATLVATLTKRAHPPAVADLRALARQEAGLALRLAMVLACIKRLDVATLGYSGFLPFCRERVDWGQAWVRALVRLVDSPLDQVKAAAAAGHLPLRIAVKAPGKVAVKDQAAWLGGAVFGRPDPGHPRHTLRGREAEDVHRAGAVARGGMGRDAPVAELDDYILRHWREQIPGAALEEGRNPPPVPEPPPLDFDWAASPTGSPAEALLGPWQAPTTLPEALAQLEVVQAVRRGREALLAQVFARVHERELWRDAGFDSPWAFAERVFGWSRRTAERQRNLGWALSSFPQLDEAVCAGFSLDGACDIGWIVDTDAQCNRWLDLARHLGRQELRRAMANEGERLEDYERAVAIARRNAAALLGPGGPTSRPSGTVEVYRIGGEAEACRDASSAGTDVGDDAPSRAGTPEGVLRVALPLPEPEPAGTARGHPRLAEAARWFLENNPLPRLSGFASSKHRARYRCENPECGRVTLCVAAHHVHWRRHGGTDDLTNAVVLCPSCHLRCVHTLDERIRVSRVVVEGLEALLWEYPHRPPILQFRDYPGAARWSGGAAP